MIVNMKKVTLLMGVNHKTEALERLRQLGVLHIKNITPPMSDDISSIQTKIDAVEQALQFLETKKDDKSQKTQENPASIVKEFHQLKDKKNHLEDEIVEILEEYEWYQKWGHVDKQDIDYLAKKGIYIKLYDCDKSVLKNIPEDMFVKQIKEFKHAVLLAYISDKKNDRLLDLKHEVIPDKPYEEVEREVDIYKQHIEAVNSELAQLAVFYDLLSDYHQNLQKQLEFQEVKYGMGNKESISYLQGFCPADKTSDLKQQAEESGWGYLIDDPKETDNPPTLLKNQKWVRIIQPVFDFLGTVPGYREYDISKYFLVFFALYFAMIIGDAGYGMLFLLGSMFAHKKTKKPNAPTPLAIKLLYVVSTTTILWGTVSGNWFGSPYLASLDFFKSLTIPQIASFPEVFPEITAETSQNRVMFICFILALVQLGLANIMNFFNTLPGLKSLGHIGWLSMTAGLFFLVLNLVLGMNMPFFAVYLIAGGLLMVVLFGSQERGKSFIKGLTAGLGGAFTTFLDSISAFSNIISYIRLFAVGMASVAIASSFNDIASPLLKGATLPAGILVLMIGHGLNIVMGMLSVVVHGIRLNVLEFSGQLGIEWSGYKYKPFKNKK